MASRQTPTAQRPSRLLRPKQVSIPDLSSTSSTAPSKIPQTVSGRPSMSAVKPQTTSPTVKQQSPPVVQQTNENVEELKEKIKDLESKLETILIRRSHDKEKLNELERLKIQCQQLLENKRQMSEKITDLSKSKAVAEKEAKEARDEQLRHAEEMTGLVETAEMAVIDKEMVENKYEQCLSELEQTKEKLEEVTLDLEILKSEIEEKGSDGVVNSYKMIQLEQQNERLKDALLKLRDIHDQDKNELQKISKELDKNKVECNDLQKLREKLSAEVSQYEEQIVDLKEQIDIALGAQEMVEKLTEKNLALEDKLNEMQEALDEEENIRDLNNQLIEAKEEQVLELKEEIDLNHSKISVMKQEFAAVQETMADYESTIKKFRDLVAELRNEINELRKQTDNSKNKNEAEQELEINDFNVRISDRKAFGRAIDMELRRLEVDQSQKHISFLSKFMPDTFFVRGGDHDAIQVLLFIPRLIKKCEIIERQIIEKYRSLDIKDVNKQNVVENHDNIRQQVFTRQLLYVLFSTQSILGNYINSLQSCNCELFLKIGSLFPELVVHERTIDYFIDLLKNDKLDETVLIDPLEKTLNYFQSLYNIHLADNRSYDHSKLLNDFVTLMKSASDASHLDIIILGHLCADSQVLDDISTFVDDIDQFCKKIKRRLISDTKLKLDESVENEICDCIAIMNRVTNALKVIRTNALKVRKPFDSKQLEQFAVEVGGLKFLNDSLQSVMTICCQISTGLQQGDYDDNNRVEVCELMNPIDSRAKLWKAQIEEIDTLKLKLEHRESEISELKRAIKAKIDETSEMQIRRDLAEKKLLTSSKDADERVVKLQNELDHLLTEFKRKENDFEKTLNKYNQEINDLYLDQRNTKEKLKNLSKIQLMENLLRTTSGPTGTVNEEMLVSQISDLRSALKRVSDQNWYLRVKIAERRYKPKTAQKMSDFKPIWLLRAQGKEAEIDPKQEKLLSLTKQLNDLQNDIRVAMINETIWDFKKPIKKQIEHEVLSRLDFTVRYEKLERDTNDFIKQWSDGYLINSHFTSFPLPYISKCLTKNKSELAAVLTIPSTKPKKVKLEVTHDQLKQLHAQLVI